MRNSVYVASRRPNFTMKLVRPASVRRPSRLLPAQATAASRRLQALIACTRVLAATGVPLGFGTRDRPHSLS